MDIQESHRFLLAKVVSDWLRKSFEWLVQICDWLRKSSHWLRKSFGWLRKSSDWHGHPKVAPLPLREGCAPSSII